MPQKSEMPRAALSPREFAALFGKEQTWGYRQIYSGKVTTITEYGRILIPASEVERILGQAGRYNGMKPHAARAPKPEPSKLAAWRKLMATQAGADIPMGKSSANGRRPSTKQRKVSAHRTGLERFARSRRKG